MRPWWVLLLIATPAAAQAPMSGPDSWQSRNQAELVFLDKVRAQPTAAAVRVGQSTTFGSLTITVRSCMTRPPDLPQDSAVFLDITDSRPGGASFRGWMLANEPSINILEHPIYDVRLTACR